MKGSKICKRCGIPKLYKSFPKSGQGSCRQCRNEMERARK